MQPLSLLACQIDVPPTPNPSARDTHVRILCEKLVKEAQSNHASVDLIVLKLPQYAGDGKF